MAWMFDKKCTDIALFCFTRLMFASWLALKITA